MGIRPQWVQIETSAAPNRANAILCDAHTPPLRRFNQGAEVAVTGKQHHLANILSELHGIDGEPDVHATLHPAPAAGFDEFCSLPRRIIRYGADKSSKKSALSAAYLAVGRLLSEPSMTTFPSFVRTHHRHVVRPRFFKIT
jgi:hypothetical protein